MNYIQDWIKLWRRWHCLF